MVGDASRRKMFLEREGSDARIPPAWRSPEVLILSELQHRGSLHYWRITGEQRASLLTSFINTANCTPMAVSLKRPAATAICAATRYTSSSLLPPASYRWFSVLNRPPPNYEGHIPLTRTERLGLALGSGLLSFLDPRRGGIHLIHPPWHL